MLELSQVEHLAKLARVAVTTEEQEKYREQISAILDYFKTLGELDTTDVEPLTHVAELTNVSRPDKVKQIFEQNLVLAEAPELENNLLKVPAVFDR